MSNRNTSQRDRDRARIKATRAACGICGAPIDYELPHTDEMSFVADHIIPLTPPHNGPDNFANKQAAHRICNSKKRARLIAPIVRRSQSLN